MFNTHLEALIAVAMTLGSANLSLIIAQFLHNGDYRKRRIAEELEGVGFVMTFLALIFYGSYWLEQWIWG